MKDQVFVLSEIKVIQARLRSLNRSNRFAKDVAAELTAIHDRLEEVLGRVESQPKRDSRES